MGVCFLSSREIGRHITFKRDFSMSEQKSEVLSLNLNQCATVDTGDGSLSQRLFYRVDGKTFFCTLLPQKEIAKPSFLTCYGHFRMGRPLWYTLFERRSISSGWENMPEYGIFNLFSILKTAIRSSVKKVNPYEMCIRLMSHQLMGSGISFSLPTT